MATEAKPAIHGGLPPSVKEFQRAASGKFEADQHRGLGRFFHRRPQTSVEATTSPSVNPDAWPTPAQQVAPKTAEEDLAYIAATVGERHAVTRRRVLGLMVAVPVTAALGVVVGADNSGADIYTPSKLKSATTAPITPPEGTNTTVDTSINNIPPEIQRAVIGSVEPKIQGFLNSEAAFSGHWDAQQKPVERDPMDWHVMMMTSHTKSGDFIVALQERKMNQTTELSTSIYDAGTNKNLFIDVTNFTSDGKASTPFITQIRYFEQPVKPTDQGKWVTGEGVDLHPDINTTNDPLSLERFNFAMDVLNHAVVEPELTNAAGQYFDTLRKRF